MFRLRVVSPLFLFFVVVVTLLLFLAYFRESSSAHFGSFFLLYFCGVAISICYLELSSFRGDGAVINISILTEGTDRRQP